MALRYITQFDLTYLPNWDVISMSKAEAVIDRLSKIYKIMWRPSHNDFDILVATILSQNTNRENTQKAFSRLKEKVRSFKDLLALDETKLKELIRPAGLYNVKSKRLKKLAKIMVEKYGGSLDSILRKPPREAREELLSIEGVGPKTADIILAFKKGLPVVPVDTHIFRVAKRVGVASPKADYEGVRSALEDGIPPEKRQTAHLLLIQFGREICRARNPECPNCPIYDLCDNPVIVVKK